jgi:hypothetical protein
MWRALMITAALAGLMAPGVAAADTRYDVLIRGGTV